jgi:hypothetical protein
MELAELLDRCSGLKTRSGALYRRFAEDACQRPELQALWVAMARDEDEHAIAEYLRSVQTGSRSSP